MPTNEDDSLHYLDSTTDWDEGGDVAKTTNDSDESWGESIPNILDCLRGLFASGELADVIVIGNTKTDEQLLFTNLERNDLIIGRMQIAMMNWYNNELSFRDSEDC